MKESLQTEIKHHSCFAHVLQLVIKDGFKASNTTARILKKCSKIVKFVKKSTLATEILENENKLQIANQTRWNSQLKMVRSILTIPVEKLNMLNTSMLTLYERNVLNEVLDILSPFEEATDLAQLDNHVNAGFLITCIIGLKFKLDNLRLNVKFDKKLVDELKQSLTRRMEQYENDSTFILASILDPRFKLEWCRTEAEKFEKTEILHRSLYYLSPRIELPEQQCKDPPKRRKLFDFMEPIVAKLNDSEFEKYIKQLALPDDTDPLKFWKTEQNNFPNLSRLAIDVLSVPASSAAVERVFIIAGQLYRPERCRLTTKHFEQLMFIRANYESIKSKH